MASEGQSNQFPQDQQSDKQIEMNIDPIFATGGSPIKFEDKFRDFARTKLHQRECSSFIPKTVKGEGFAKSELAQTCYCGRNESWHQERGINTAADSGAKWTPETHTNFKPTAAYGRIEFKGFGNQTESSYYARVDYCTEPEVLWKLLSDVWNLGTPKLVLSIIGGAKRFSMKPRLANAFKQGLINVASSTDAWIVTGGTATGVMQYVGDAAKKHKLLTAKQLVAIGIATWGYIDNNACLESSDGSGKFPAVYNIRSCAEGIAPLDHNHTSFILIDNGTANIYGAEIALRANLEAHIKTKSAAEGVHTPVVLIVCEGGINILEQTRDAIECAIPVVVIKGSGRAADLISEAYRLTKPKHGDEQSSLPDDYQTKMESLISNTFENLNQDTIDRAVGHLEMILSQRTLMTIFEMSDVDCQELDKAILSALLKAKKAYPESQINLALIWNRPDIARHEIFSVENRKQWKKVGLRQPVCTLADIAFSLEDREISIHDPAGCFNVNFLLHDDGPNHNERIIMLGTTASIGQLTTAPRVYADGTFKICPSPFKQLYVLYAEHADSKLFPAVFVLLPGKSRTIYDRMLQIISALCPNISPTQVMTDFEYQAMQSFEQNLHIDVSGCFFHFAQAIKQKFEYLRSTQATANGHNNSLVPLNPLMKQHYVMLRALAFLPPDDIPPAFNALICIITEQNNLSVFADMIEYMRSSWVCPPRDVIGLSSFPPVKWSVHMATLNDQPRTNHRLEGWHLKINKLLNAHRPDIYQFNFKLKKFFRAEEDRWRQMRAVALVRQNNALAQGIAVPPQALNFFSRKSADLKTLCQHYQNGRYVTASIHTGLIRFLSEIAAVLMRHPPGSGV